MWTYNNTDELYHYGVKGMKWGVRRASKISERLTKHHQKTAEDYSKIRSDIKKGNYKKYGYKSQNQANADLKNWNRMIKDEHKIAKNWADTNAKVSTLNDSKQARKLLKEGRKFAHNVMFKNDRYVMKNAVTEEVKKSTTYQNGKIVVDEVMKNKKGRTSTYARVTVKEANNATSTFHMYDIDSAHRIGRDGHI